jgi:predicted amidohydrolase
MSRVLTVAAAQLGPIPRSDSRARVVKRLSELLREAASRGCELVVFPELAHPLFSALVDDGPGGN